MSFDRKRIEELLAADAYAAGLGVDLVSVSDTEVVIGMDLTGDHANFLGSTHGGVVFSLADCAFSLASNSAGTAVAIDTHMVYSASAQPGDRLEARIVEMTRGRTLGTYRAEVTRGDGRLVALFTGTVYINQG
ncbi:MAG: hotdog fold thioesterase [Acidimicrobiia bacterium]|jgi:acyl-CoA thioesterase